MTTTTRTNGISANRIVWWLLASLFTLLIFSYSIINSFQRTSSVRAVKDIGSLSGKLQEISTLSAVNESKITGIESDIRSIKKKIDSVDKNLSEFLLKRYGFVPK